MTPPATGAQSRQHPWRSTARSTTLLLSSPRRHIQYEGLALPDRENHDSYNNLPPKITPPSPRPTMRQRINSTDKGYEIATDDPTNINTSREPTTQEQFRRPAMYHDVGDDSDPLQLPANKYKKAAQAKLLREYAVSILPEYHLTKLRREMFWQDFITAFRPHTMRVWTHPIAI